MSSNIHISLAAEPLFHVGTFPFYNSYLSSLIVLSFFLVVAVFIKKSNFDLKSKVYNLSEMIIEGAWDFFANMTGDRKLAREILPWVLTFFLFILFNNWFGLVPGVGSLSFYPSGKEHHAESHHADPEKVKGATAHDYAVHPEYEEAEYVDQAKDHIASEEHHASHSVHVFRAANSDLNITLALALISAILTQYLGFKKLGLKGYGGKFLNFTNPILFFVGILEIVSEIVKVFSFSFRLFGNIFAGEVLLAVILSLVPVIVPITFYGVEFFAGFIQALIFSMLTLVFINTATTHH